MATFDKAVLGESLQYSTNVIDGQSAIMLEGFTPDMGTLKKRLFNALEEGAVIEFVLNTDTANYRISLSMESINTLSEGKILVETN